MHKLTTRLSPVGGVPPALAAALAPAPSILLLRPAVRSSLSAILARLVAAHHARQQARVDRAMRLGLGAID
jgi:hypothetical protein